MAYYIRRKKKNNKEKPTPLFDAAGAKVKRQPDLKAKLDKEFSLFIRLRDSKPFGYKYFKCPTCGRILPFEKADCSHFHSRRHLGTRYDEDNCHAECRACNRFSADHLIGYERYLIAKIGQQRFDMLKVKAASTTKMSDFEYKELIKYYKTLNKKMLSEK